MSTESNKRIKLPVINTLLLVCILGYLVINSLGSTETQNQVYVVTGELFSEFDYQKELNQEFLIIKNDREKELELMKGSLVTLENRIRGGLASETEVQQYQIGYGQFQQAEMTVNSELAAVNDDYNTKIWAKLNAFVTEFGESKGYEVIFGAGGTGNIMYADDKMNVTTEVIQFCNSKYKGL